MFLDANNRSLRKKKKGNIYSSRRGNEKRRGPGNKFTLHAEHTWFVFRFHSVNIFKFVREVTRDLFLIG